MSLNFWDGVLIASAFWVFVSTISLIRGFWVGSNYYPDSWSEGYEVGWKSAEEYYGTEILERERGLNV